MENAAKALEIAAGVLLGVLLLSLIAYFFSTIGEWPQSEEDNISAEQLAKFNLEYEVYEKNAMYGVDVISCLNKAISNNETYVENDREKSFLSGTAYGSKYFVDICISINSALSETIEIYYFDEANFSEERRAKDATISTTLEQIHEDNPDFELPDKEDDKLYTALTYNDKLVSNDHKLENEHAKYLQPKKGSETFNGKKYYALSNNNDYEIIKSLIRFSKISPKITFKNANTNTLKLWSTAEWTTALYDFKTKRFKCDAIQYSESTGRVNKIYFSEI